MSSEKRELHDNYHVVYAMKEHKEEFVIAGVFSKAKDAGEMVELLKDDPTILPGSCAIVPETMEAILDALAEQRLGQLAQPIKNLVSTLIENQQEKSTDVEE